MREAISVPGTLPDRPFSAGLRDGSLLAISGQVSVDEQWHTVGVGDFEAQARRTFENIGQVLEGAGADFSHVAELTYYLVDLDDFSTLDRVRRDYLIGPPYPGLDGGRGAPPPRPKLAARGLGDRRSSRLRSPQIRSSAAPTIVSASMPKCS